MHTSDCPMMSYVVHGIHCTPSLQLQMHPLLQSLWKSFQTTSRISTLTMTIASQRSTRCGCREGGHALRTSQDTTCGGVRCRAVVEACSCAFLLFPAHQNVEPNHNPTVDAFSNPANAQKNRYGNITCCECGFSDSAHALEYVVTPPLPAPRLQMTTPE